MMPTSRLPRSISENVAPVHIQMNHQICLGPSLGFPESLDALPQLNKKNVAAAGHAPIVAIPSFVCVSGMPDIEIWRTASRTANTGTVMSPDEDCNCKTAWDKTAEAEWVDEQWAADEDRRAHQNPGLQLQPNTGVALINMSPEGAWLQVTDLVLQAIEEHWEEAERLGRGLGIGG
jgi:hypothetical protein